MTLLEKCCLLSYLVISLIAFLWTILCVRPVCPATPVKNMDRIQIYASRASMT